ncbi:IclR family transcriptional regulator [Variovorax sp. M-6]|uniref:IclR family transcriptional regulator n=1 Tax=Variovorax sp. M-6 TaxID=3233041 RepID=UPI003F9A86FF
MDVKQVVNALELMEFFAAHGRPATLAEISKHFGWPRSSTFNLLGTLASRGYLYEPKAREGFYPSPNWRLMFDKIDRAAPTPSELQTVLKALCARTNETAVLAGISGSHALFIATVEPEQAVRYAAAVGKMVPLHLTATGRALLSQLPESERAAFLRKAVYERHTPTTLMSVEAVEAEIERSTRRGWFEGAGEFTPDLGGIAMPLQVEQRHLALLVAGPVFRVQPRQAEIVRIMQEEIARHLPPPKAAA